MKEASRGRKTAEGDHAKQATHDDDDHHHQDVELWTISAYEDLQKELLEHSPTTDESAAALVSTVRKLPYIPSDVKDRFCNLVKEFRANENKGPSDGTILQPPRGDDDGDAMENLATEDIVARLRNSWESSVIAKLPEAATRESALLCGKDQKLHTRLDRLLLHDCLYEECHNMQRRFGTLVDAVRDAERQLSMMAGLSTHTKQPCFLTVNTGHGMGNLQMDGGRFQHGGHYASNLLVDKRRKLKVSELLTSDENVPLQKLVRVSKVFEDLIMASCQNTTTTTTTTTTNNNNNNNNSNNITNREEAQKYKAQMMTSMGWFQSKVKQETGKRKHSPSENDLCFPNGLAEEKEGALVVLSFLFEAIAECFTEEHSSRFHYAMHDDFLQLLHKETSSVFGKGSDGRVQDVFAHLCQACYQGLRFGNVGVSTSATGVSSNLASIQVHELRLGFNMVVSDDSRPVTVESSSSRKLPFMSKKCFDGWMMATRGNVEERVSLERLREELYGDDGEGVDNLGIPLGMRVLWELFSKRRSELSGPDYKAILNGNFGDVLGSGSSGVVLEHGDDEVIKVSWRRSCKRMTNEVVVLRALGRLRKGGDNAAAAAADDDDSVSLPTLVREVKVKSVVGGLTKGFTGLVMKPRGTPMAPLARKRCFSLEELLRFGEQIKCALEYIHARGVHHNDVAPANIVVVRNGTSQRAFLVDFGCATMQPESEGLGEGRVHGFVGRRFFAHDDVLRHSVGEVPWRPKDEYDMTALGFTMAVLLNDNEVAWSYPMWGCDPIELEEMLKERREAAVGILRLGQGADEWMGWIDSVDQEMPLSVGDG